IDKTIKNLFDELSGSNDSSDIRSVLNKISFGVKELKQYLESQSSDNTLTNLSPEELNVVNKANDVFQLSVLGMFEKLHNLASNIQALQSAINTDTKGLGASYSAVQAKTMQIQRLFNNPDGGVNSEGYPILNAHNL